MSLCKPGLLVLGLLAAAACCQLPAARTAERSVLQAEAGDKGAKPRKPKFTISKETTYVTGPLTPDGYIDYVTALNERLRRGVTPENNANVLFWKAFGPRPFGANMPPEFFKWLGYQPPERGDYFIDLLPYIKKRFQVDVDKQADKLGEQLERAAQRPWTVQDYPHIASWLKANTHPLALVVEGTRRSHYYSPAVLPDRPNRELPGLLSAPIPAVSKCRDLAKALAARAMLRVEEGRHDDAWQDLLACHRLGRHVASGGSLFEALVGIAIDRVAATADLAYLERAQLTAQQVKDRLRDLKNLPPMPTLAKAVDCGERFMFLDVTLLLARDGQSALHGVLGLGAPLDKAIKAVEKRFWDNVDWDVVLRNGNRWYGRAAAVLHLGDRGERERQLNLIEMELKKLAVRLGNREKLARDLLGAKKNARVQSQILQGILKDLLIARLTPNFSRVQHSRDSAEQAQTNLHLAFALVAYKREYGRYPMKLEALAPRYLPHIPQDLFSGKPLIYRPSAKGYLLYSVGVNGEDEQGQSEEDDPSGDDLVVRMPLPEPRRK
jgi:hypothetical protein